MIMFIFNLFYDNIQSVQVSIQLINYKHKLTLDIISIYQQIIRLKIIII